MEGPRECVGFGNLADTVVTIRDIKIEGQPQETPVFEIVQMSSLDDCGTDGRYRPDRWCDDAQLPPDEDSQVTCAVEVEFTGTAYHTARLLFSLEARCTGTDGEPCNATEVGRRQPTPAEPVIVEWEWGIDLEASPQEQTGGS